MKYSYVKEVTVATLETEIRNSAIITALDYIILNNTNSLDIYFKSELSAGDKVLLDGVVENHQALPIPEENTPVEVVNIEHATPGDLTCTWAQLKALYDSVSSNAYMNYIDLGTHYYVWVTFRDQKAIVPELLKGDATQFESSYKSKCNIPEWPRSRITTCKSGRKFHSRFINFFTSDQDNFDNTDYADNEFGDVTYTLKDINRQTTTVNSEAKETWIDWEPTYDFELVGGIFYIPSYLATRNLEISSIEQSNGIATGYASGHGLRKYSVITISGAEQDGYNGVKEVITRIDENYFTFKVLANTPAQATGTIVAEEGDDAWELHALAVPDIPAQSGGSIIYVANPRLKWLKGQPLGVTVELNPSELRYNATYHTSKVRVIVKHPVGVQSEFQVNFRMFK